MAVLSFFFPVAGWIIWAVKKDSNPEDALKCAKWAWIGVGSSVLLTILGSCSLMLL